MPPDRWRATTATFDTVLSSMRSFKLGIPVIVAVAALSVGACSDDDASDPAAGTAPDGAALYEQSCASCHGSDLRGTERGPSHLSQVYEPGHHPDAAFRAAVTAGSRAHHWDFGDMASGAWVERHRDRRCHRLHP